LTTRNSISSFDLSCPWLIDKNIYIKKEVEEETASDGNDKGTAFVITNTTTISSNGDNNDDDHMDPFRIFQDMGQNDTRNDMNDVTSSSGSSSEPLSSSSLFVFLLFSNILLPFLEYKFLFFAL